MRVPPPPPPDPSRSGYVTLVLGPAVESVHGCPMIEVHLWVPCAVMLLAEDGVQAQLQLHSVAVDRHDKVHHARGDPVVLDHEDTHVEGLPRESADDGHLGAFNVEDPEVHSLGAARTANQGLGSLGFIKVIGVTADYYRRKSCSTMHVTFSPLFVFNSPIAPSPMLMFMGLSAMQCGTCVCACVCVVCCVHVC